MTLEADPTSGSAGGKWKISIYDLTEAVETTEIVAEPAEEMDETIGGDTDAGEEQTPVESGSRAFTVVNNCKQTLRIGSTGGRCACLDNGRFSIVYILVHDFVCLPLLSSTDDTRTRRLAIDISHWLQDQMPVLRAKAVETSKFVYLRSSRRPHRTDEMTLSIIALHTESTG